MAELQLAREGLYSLAFGGDTLNTSWYVRALADPAALEVEYVSAVGRDPMSGQLLDFFKANEIGSAFVRTIVDRNLGLYLISLAGAERSFTYWRSSSAAKLLAEDRDHLAAVLSGADVIYFSGITLAILAPAHLEILFDVLQHARGSGTTIAFDSNIRPRLWASAEEMKQATVRGYQAATVALPTYPDEQALFRDASPRAAAQRIADYGVAELIVKDGDNAACGLVGDEAFEVAPQAVTSIIDTTGAGDSFNAGYLVGRMAKMSPAASAALGHRVAGRVIGHRGALTPMAQFADLRWRPDR